jgi:hypothetical protein
VLLLRARGGPSSGRRRPDRDRPLLTGVVHGSRLVARDRQRRVWCAESHTPLSLSFAM